MFVAIMLMSRFVTEFLPPNVHLLGLLMAVLTLTYRGRALVPMYVFILLYGVLRGFSVWWLPYLYVWLPLWGMFMVAGWLRLSAKFAAPLYAILCGLHGLMFGLLYAPAQALFFGFSFEMAVAWVVAGFPFDIMHAVGNLVVGTLIFPLATLMQKLNGSQ